MRCLSALSGLGLARHLDGFDIIQFVLVQPKLVVRLLALAETVLPPVGLPAGSASDLQALARLSCYVVNRLLHRDQLGALGITQSICATLQPLLLQLQQLCLRLNEVVEGLRRHAVLPCAVLRLDVLLS